MAFVPDEELLEQNGALGVRHPRAVQPAWERKTWESARLRGIAVYLARSLSSAAGKRVQPGTWAARFTSRHFGWRGGL